MLHPPAAGHLLDHELRVHPDRDRGRVELGRGAQPGEQPVVLGHVVGGPPQRRGPLGQHLAGVGVPDHRAVAGRARVAARAAVGLDDQPAAHSPDSGVRTRMRRQFSQRSTSSGGAAWAARSSAPISSSRQPSHRRCRSIAAPTPPEAARTFSYRASRSAGSPVGEPGPGLGVGGGLGVDLGERLVPGLLRLGPGRGHLLHLGPHRAGAGLGLLAPLHHLQLGVLQVGLPAGQRLDLVLQALQLLGRHRPGQHPLLVPLGPPAHLVDVVLQPAQLPVEVADLGLGPDHVVAQRGQPGVRVGDHRRARAACAGGAPAGPARRRAPAGRAAAAGPRDPPSRAQP